MTQASPGPRRFTFAWVSCSKSTQTMSQALRSLTSPFLRYSSYNFIMKKKEISDLESVEKLLLCSFFQHFQLALIDSNPCTLSKAESKNFFFFMILNNV